jgi:MFS family permease
MGRLHGVSQAPAPSSRAQELSRSRRRLVLAICCMSLLIVGLDNTIVNVALPSIGRELHASVSELQWTVDAYTLVLASLLMLGGSMGDRFGRRRVFQTGLALFTLGSLLCSAAPSLGWLIVFRMLQAVGGSMLNPVAMSIIRNVFTDARERAQAIGMWGATIGISLALGPVLGGALVDGVDWRAIFWINIPVGLLGADDALRPRVARAEAATPRSRRPAAGDSAARLAHLRDHRGAISRLVLDADAWPVRPGSDCARVARAI